MVTFIEPLPYTKHYADGSLLLMAIRWGWCYSSFYFRAKSSGGLHARRGQGQGGKASLSASKALGEWEPTGGRRIMCHRRTVTQSWGTTRKGRGWLQPEDLQGQKTSRCTEHFNRVREVAVVVPSRAGTVTRIPHRERG